MTRTGSRILLLPLDPDASAQALRTEIGAQQERAAQAGKRVALVLGISAYQHVAKLPNPSNDAGAMADLLRKSGFGRGLAAAIGAPVLGGVVEIVVIGIERRLPVITVSCDDDLPQALAEISSNFNLQELHAWRTPLS